MAAVRVVASVVEDVVVIKDSVVEVLELVSEEDAEVEVVSGGKASQVKVQIEVSQCGCRVT